jgi:hypothetical protein
MLLSLLSFSFPFSSFSYSPLSLPSSSGQWWERRFITTQLAPVQYDETVWEDWLSTPEFFHLDMFPVWKRYASALERLFTCMPLTD